MMPKKVLKHSPQNKFTLILLILCGSATWSLTMFKSGLMYSFGLGFWGPNGHDGVWHVALANSLSRGSLEMPTFAGSGLQNYHIGFDLILAILHKITAIPVSVLYFQVVPIILSVLIGVLSFVFVYIWNKSFIHGLWSVFFVYFGGSLGWAVGKGESAFWSQQAVSTLINPPFAFSLVLLLSGLIFLKKSKNLILPILCFGILIQIKAYAAILILGALFIAGIFELLRNKNSYILKVFIGSLILNVLLFLPLNKFSSGLLVFQPFWFLETLMGFSDRFGWPKLYEAMLSYKSGNSIKFFPAYGLAFVIFWFGNIGTRVIKELEVIRWIKNYKKIGFEEVFFSSIIVLGIVLPMLFLQKGTPWNTIQFLYYALFFSSLLAGVAAGKLLSKFKKPYLALPVSSLIIIFTVPTTIITLKDVYLPTRPPAKLSIEEIEALKFLANQPNGVVLAYPFDKDKANEAISNPPRPLYLYETTAYVAAFANKPVFLEDQVNLDITGYDWEKRREEVLDAWQDPKKMNTLLRENKISYVYLLNSQPKNDELISKEKIFENNEVGIYKVEN